MACAGQMSQIEESHGCRGRSPLRLLLMNTMLGMLLLQCQCKKTAWTIAMWHSKSFHNKDVRAKKCKWTVKSETTMTPALQQAWTKRTNKTGRDMDNGIHFPRCLLSMIPLQIPIRQGIYGQPVIHVTLSCGPPMLVMLVDIEPFWHWFFSRFSSVNFQYQNYLKHAMRYGLLVGEGGMCGNECRNYNNKFSLSQLHKHNSHLKKPMKRYMPQQSCNAAI